MEKNKNIKQITSRNTVVFRDFTSKKKQDIKNSTTRKNLVEKKDSANFVAVR